MRTTFTLDPDVERLLRARMSERKATLKTVVNDALRRGLSVTSPKSSAKRFRVTPFSLGLRPGIDPDKLSQLLDELEVEEHARKLAPHQR